MHNPFLITDSPFSGKPNEALLVLKDLQPVGLTKQVGLGWLFCKRTKKWASHFQKEKKLLGWSVVNIKEKVV